MAYGKGLGGGPCQQPICNDTQNVDPMERVVHACNEKGLKVKEGEELWEAIAEQFELGTIGLLSTDRHYIIQGCNVVEAMTAAEQKTMAPWNSFRVSGL